MDNTGDTVNELSPELEEEMLMEENIEDLPVEEIEEEAPKKGKSSKKSKQKKSDSKARTASAAVFFNENKSIAGFGNSMRAVFTSVRELVENSLDASEKRGVTPNIVMSLRKLDKKELSKLMGTSIVKSKKDTRLDFLEIKCKDNGIGVKRELIPQLFGTVLAGTKYGAQQTRGRFGLGSKMVLLYAMSTLDLPIQITTRPEGENRTYRVKLFINLEKNEPIIHKDEVFEEGDERHFDDYGTEISVSFTGSWNLAKLYVREYFQQLAIITPYADITVTLPGDDGNPEEFVFQRVVDDLPKPPEVVQIHPWGTDISTFRRELTHATESTLIDFLANNFMGVTVEAAEKFFQEVEVDGKKLPHELTSQEIRRIVHDGFNQALKESKTVKRKRDRRFAFSDPEGDALSPLGAIRLRKGLEKELNPDFVETITRDPKAYEGHPFVIEAAIGYGIKLKEISKAATVVDNRIIYRFANRIPLIFGAGSDLITTVTNSIKWSDYGLTRGTETLAIAVSLVSTKIPFPETSKEYIDKVEEIGQEVKLTLEALGRKLRTFLGRSRRRQREKRRKSRFAEYAPSTVNNLLDILRKEEIWNPTTGVSPSRIIAALSSGIPRIDSRIYPPGRPIYGEAIWSSQELQEKLQENGIYEISSFLRTDNGELSNYLDTTPEDVDRIKRRTITELEFKGDIPELDIGIFMDSDVERRFHGRDDKNKEVLGLSRLSKSLPRRWIRNVYDYLVSPVDQLLKVQGLGAKLLEADKYKVITSLMESLDESDLSDDLAAFFGETAPKSQKQMAMIADDALQGIENLLKSDEPEITLTDSDEVVVEAEPSGAGPQVAKSEKIEIILEQLLPPLELLYEIEDVKKRKVTSILEFLFETAHPSNPIDEKVLSSVTIPTFKQNLAALVDYNPAYGEIKVSVSSQPWIDGYLRNAFKRKKIDTVSDIIKTGDDVLQDIGELQRTLYAGVIKTLIPEKGTIKIEEFLTESAKEKIKILKSIGIITLEQFASSQVLQLEKDPKLADYLTLLIEETKDKLIDNLTMNNKLGSLRLIKDIKLEVEQFLIEEGISSSLDLMTKSLEFPSKSVEAQLISAKQQLGRNFSGFTKKMEKAFKDADVSTIDELVYHPDKFLSKELSETSKEELIKAVQILQLPISLISPNLIPTFNVLVDAGVTNIGKFLIWPSSELAQITMMTEEWINLIKESFDIKDYKASKIAEQTKIGDVAHLVGDKQLTVLDEYKIDTVEKLTQIKWGDIFPSQLDEWTPIAKLNNLVTSDIDELATLIKVKKERDNFDKVVEDLKKSGIDTILKFIRTPEATLKSNIKTKTKITQFEKFMEALRSLDESYLNSETEIFKFFIIYNANQELKSPIVFLSEFEKAHIDLLNLEGIKTINQLFTIPIKEAAEFLGKSQKAVSDMLANSKLQSAGTPLAIQDKGKMSPVITFEHDGTSYFGKDDLDSLYENGYNTLESIFYTADPRTFELPGISWEIINQFKKLLGSPPVFISWKYTRMEKIEKTIELSTEDEMFSSSDKKEDKPKEVQESTEKEGEEEKLEAPQEVEVEYYITFTSKELDSLSKAKINRVIDFVSSDSNELAKILEWEEPLVKERQTTIILQEVGIGLSELEIFRQDHIAHLASMGLSTIEDIYFTTDKDSWDSDILPYEPIETINKIVNLSLINAVEELGEEIVNILLANGVETILDLILTGDPILEQKTGLPAERFENVKYSLDFGSLINAFDKSVLFTPGVLYHQAFTLMENGYHRIIDILLEKPTKIAKLLELGKKDVEELMAGITRSSILKCEEDRGVPLRDLNGFSRSDLRSVAKSGIFDMNEVDTLQELLFQITPEIFQGEQYLLDLTLDIQKICTIKLDQIGDINQDDVKLLASHNIHTIGDALMVSYEDLPTDDSKVDASLNFVSNSIKDLSPFLAMARLPVTTILETDFEGEKIPDLLDVYLNQTVDVDPRAMRNIRSLLQIPVRFTSYFKKYTGESEEILDLTIAELLLEYNPEDHPNTLLRSLLHEPGSIQRLMREGSTPIPLLDIDPVAYRQLLVNGYTSIEKILLVDEKHLATITGSTQKYWKNIKDIFDPEVFIARIGDIGIPISVLNLNPDEKKELDELDISYLDQVTVFPHSEGILKKLNNFVHASITFLIGTPGEKEISQNADARNIIESIIVMRNQGANQDVLTEMIYLAWQAYTQNAIELPKSLQEKAHQYGLNYVQDLVTYVNTTKDKVPKHWIELSQTYSESPLLLPLNASELKEAVNTYRCATIIDALTCPMLNGEIVSIRDEINKGEDLTVRNELKLPTDIIKKLSGQTYKRIEGLNLSLQDIICSPRTIEEYKGVKQKYLNDLRQLIKTPLTRFHLENNQFIVNRNRLKQYYRLEDLVLNLSKINKKEPEMYKAITELITSPKTEVCNDIVINAEVKRSAETILNYSVDGFHELWASTSQGQSVFTKTDTTPVQQIRTYLWKSSACITNLKSLDPESVSVLFNYDIYTLADVLLAHESYLFSIPVLTRKSVKSIQEESIKLLDVEEMPKSIDLRSIAGKLGFSTSSNSDLGIHLIGTSNYHPVYRELVIQEDLRKYLEHPIFLINSNLTISQLYKLIQNGVNTAVDFLLVPEGAKFLSNDVKSLDARISMLGDDRTINDDYELETLSLSSDLMKSTNATKISEFIIEALSPGKEEVLKQISIPINYLDIENGKLDDFAKIGVLSTIDLFIANPKKSAEILDKDPDEMKTFMKSIDFEKLYSKLINRPLQVKDFQSISQKGREKLIEQNIITLMDIDSFNLEGFSRNDEVAISNAIYLLETDLSVLLTTGLFKIQDLSGFEEKGIKRVRDLILNRDEFKDAIADYLDSLTPDILVKLIDQQQPFSSLPLISKKDEKSILKAGIFTFSSLSKISIEELEKFGLKKDKASELRELLLTPWSYMKNISSDLKDIIEKRDCENVADVLTMNLPESVKLPDPIEVKKMVKLSNYYSQTVPDFIATFNIETLSDLFNSEVVMTAYKDGNEEVVTTIGYLGAHLSNVSTLNSKWTSKWVENGITRVWQYLMKDTSDLANIANTSIKAQDELKEQFKLEQKRKFSIKTADKSHDDVLQTYGFYYYSDLIPDGLLMDFIKHNKDLKDLVDKYGSALSTPIWKLLPFWNRNKEEQSKIANDGVLLLDYLESVDKFDTEIYNSALLGETIDIHYLKDYLPKTISKNVSKENCVEEWIFKVYRKEADDHDVTNFLKLPLEANQSLEPSEIISFYKSGITTFADLIMSTPDQLKSILGSEERISEIQENLSSSVISDKSLPTLGLIPSTMSDAFREAGFKSWSTIVSGLTTPEVKDLRGLSINSVNSAIESSNFPISLSFEFRNLPVNIQKQIAGFGVRTFLDLLVVGLRVSELISDKEYSNILENSSKASLNKANKEVKTELSISSHIKKSDTGKYSQIGINSPIDIAIGCYDKENDLSEGIEDWINILQTPISDLDLPPKADFKNEISTLEELIVKPDDKLKTYGLSNADVAKFRETLFLGKSKSSSTKSTPAKAAKISPTKKTTSEKTTKKVTKEAEKKSTKKTSKKSSKKPTKGAKTTKKSSKK